MKAKNKIIVWANGKGGTGKSTLCILFAHDLTKNGRPVAVVDADLQQSIFELRQQDLVQNGKGAEDAPWDVIWADSRRADNIKNVMSTIKSFPGTILIDAPGNLDNDNLVPIYDNADLIVCPFKFQQIMINGTKLFADAITSVFPDKRLIFMPNMIDRRKSIEDAQKERDEEYDIQHRYKGSWLTREVPRRKCFERISTLFYSQEQSDNLEPAFQGLYKWLDK